MVDILSDIESYRPQMTITQIIKFFNSYNIIFTKTMIQSYVRSGLIPRPVDQRYYTKDHIILLSIINELKAAFSLEEIRIALNKCQNDPETIYRELLVFMKQLDSSWKTTIRKVKKETAVTNETEAIGLMVHSSSLKKALFNI